MRKNNLKLVSSRPPERIGGPSPGFVALTRNPGLESPLRFEPTLKGEFDVII